MHGNVQLAVLLTTLLFDGTDVSIVIAEFKTPKLANPKGEKRVVKALVSSF